MMRLFGGDFLFARAFELMVETGNLSVLGQLSHASRITEGEIKQMTIAGVQIPSR